MNNRLVIVDAGHGGIDSGAVGNGLLEKDLTLQASKYMYKRLKELGIPVVMTREEDTYLPKEDRIRRVLTLSNNNPNPLLIANHINAGGGEGAEVVYSLRNNSNFATLVLDKIGEKGQIKRKIYQRRLPENPNKDYYYILRETSNTEPILVEYGFIDNKKDADKLRNNLNDYVEGVVEAIAEYLGYPYNNNDLAKEEYIVEKGDTLYSLSRRFNISSDELKRINNLDSDILSIGQVLKLTDNDSLYDEYIVKKGDSLWAISKKYNIPLTELIEINNLTDLNIQINQKLLVPKTSNTYIVQSGDTLWSVSKANNLTVNELKELNNLTSNLLSVGQELIIK